MKFLLVLVVVVATCLLAVEAQRQQQRVHLESSQPLRVSVEWSRTNMKVDYREVKKIFFALKQQNRDQLEDLFWSVSDPKNKDYGKYVTIEELTNIVAPKEETQKAVESWLVSQGVVAEKLQWNLNRDIISVELPIALLEPLFHVRFSTYRHTPSGYLYSASLGPYTVPASLATHLDFVSGIVGFPRMGQSVRLSTAEFEGDKAITPDVIRARYNVTQDLINSLESNNNAVGEFQHQNYDPNDLHMFFEKYVTVGTQFSNISNVVGTNKPKEPQLEASLDTQFLMGVAPNASTWFIIVAPNAFYADLLDWITYLGNTSNIPLVHSISYGSQGDYPSESFRIRMDAEFMKAGARGLSILIASGDYGAGCLYGGGGGPHDDMPVCYFAASYPAVSAYITSVGATEFITGNTGPEAAVSQFKSGGGFDITFARPSYQDAAVQAYLATAPDLPPSGYNSSNRATPDVSALGSEYFQVINGGSLTPVGGTSASTPTFSAIVTLLNQIRLSRGDQPLGFLNPWIYQTWANNPDAFFDVVKGNNITPCCKDQTSGFTCAPGWDPITGVGTPNFAVLATLV